MGLCFTGKNVTPTRFIESTKVFQLAIKLSLDSVGALGGTPNTNQDIFGFLYSINHLSIRKLKKCKKIYSLVRHETMLVYDILYSISYVTGEGCCWDWKPGSRPFHILELGLLSTIFPAAVAPAKLCTKI